MTDTTLDGSRIDNVESVLVTLQLAFEKRGAELAALKSEIDTATDAANSRLDLIETKCAELSNTIRAIGEHVATLAPSDAVDFAPELDAIRAKINGVYVEIMGPAATANVPFPAV